MNDNCIFCKIVNKKEKAHIIWEDENHLAFLSIFPNTEGFSVVIPKKHYPSYTFDLPDSVLSELIIASKKVGKLLDKSFEDVSRTRLIMEGYGVDHAHTKLIPMHGTSKFKEWKQIHSTKEKYFIEYEGYLSSLEFKRANDNELKIQAEKIRKNNID